MTIAIVFILVEALIIFMMADMNKDLKEDNKKLKKKFQEEESINIDITARVRHWKNECFYWKDRCEETAAYARQRKAEVEMLKKQKSNTGIAFKSETAQELVKFAMTQAHPDKPNGSHERFIAYREIYEKIRK